MRNIHTIEMVGVTCALLIGVFFFVWVIVLSETVPVEYRSASPGFGWSWDFDYASAMAEAGRFGETPQPWPAKATGNRILLPLNQPLLFQGLKITYRGIAKSDRFRLDVGIERLDSSIAYPQEFNVLEARRGLTIDDRQFLLEKITPRYLRLRASDQ